METPANTALVNGATFRAWNTAPFASALAAVGLFSFLSGGYVLGRTTPVAATLLCAAAAWVWFLRRSTRPPLLFLSGLTVFAAFVVWSGSSVLWSVGPDLTWVTFNTAAFYLAVVAVLGLTPARGLQLRIVAWGYLAVAAAVGVYAFLGKGLPAVVTHAHTYARLDSPVGYWNVLSLMMVMGLCVSLAVAGDRRAHASLRTLAAAAAVPMCFTFFFTFSRGGWIALAVALVLYFAFTTTRLASLVTLTAVVVPVAFALWRVRRLDTLFTETTDDALRAVQGGVLLRWAIVALLTAAGVQLVAALLQHGVRWPRWSVVAAGAVVLAVLGVVVLGGSGRYVQTHGGTSWVNDRVHALFTDAEVGGGNGPGRLLTLTTNGRVELWREAARQSRYHRAAGTGAGTFSFAHYRFRANVGVVKHAHSQWFNVLSELGMVGLGLIIAAVALLAAAVGNPFSHRRDPLHPLLVALQAGLIAFIVHMSWDWDWDMAAVGTAAFVFIAVCVSYRATRAADEHRAAGANTATTTAAGATTQDAGRDVAVPHGRAGDPGPAAREAASAGGPAVRPWLRGWPVRVAASAALVLLAVSWLPPYLALRAENAALAASSEGRVVVALAHARRAAALDPLAVSPLVKEASLLQQLGRTREALARLRAAAKLQPQNYEVWYELGSLLHGTLGRDRAARAAFTRALALNPLDAGSRYELELLAR